MKLMLSRHTVEFLKFRIFLIFWIFSRSKKVDFIKGLTNVRAWSFYIKFHEFYILIYLFIVILDEDNMAKR